MASRNRVKQYIKDSFYHIYNRGVEKRTVFIDDQDYRVFLNLLKRYLDKKPAKDSKGREYKSLHGKMELLAFCLMPNHFHLLIYQSDEQAMTRLMRGLCTSYTSYFNKKYDRIGPLFKDRYKASRIARDDYLMHISRYIHRNPKEYMSWGYSSYSYYTDQKGASWVQTKRITELFGSKDKYKQFVADYEDYKDSIDEITFELAN